MTYEIDRFDSEGGAMQPVTPQGAEGGAYTIGLILVALASGLTGILLGALIF